MRRSFPVHGVRVWPTTPTARDGEVLEHVARQRDRQPDDRVHVVDIYMGTHGMSGAQGYHLYIGKTRIPSYGACRGGIRFKVHDRELLVSLSGQPIRFTHDDQHFFDSGFRFPWIVDRRR